jgi:predicted CXXCH cytochrome family protein
VRQTIVNPKNLSPRARASVCEQCHLAGEARVPNPGLELADFRPGMELEDVWSVYVLERQSAAPADEMKAVSHAESLALSVCAKSSGDAMWCGSCHNPHETPVNSARSYRKWCLACHGEALLQTHSSPSADCIGCHMPKQGTADVAHAAVTDHRILRDPRNQPAGTARQRLAAWREPAAGLRKRNFGLALIEVGERYRYDLLMQQGLRLLNELRESAASDPAVMRDGAVMRDPAVMAAIGKALYGRRQFAGAAAMFEAAGEIEPRVADHPLHLGSVYRELGESGKAIEYFERAIQLDPGRRDAYQGLATLFRETSRPQQARGAMLRYEEFLNRR